MAILTSKKARTLQQKDIDEKLRELRLELSKERAAGNVGGTVKSPGRMKEIRRTIARILTIMKEKKQ
ncbi:MAG: 50S ribosomal protein L29 [Candidatus Aenigmarchaeota archaeon]|nr:50S ribosomal protein L29 [Candidatus Aenigmarchaeota archaeon]